MREAYIFDGLRTPFGKHGGALSMVRPDDLLAGVIRDLVARNPFLPEAIEDVIAGCSNQAGEDSRNVARNAALLAGLPQEVPGLTVNRLCGSGLAALIDASRAIRLNDGDLFVAGGVESMSRAPFVTGKSTRPFSRDVSTFDSTIGSRFPNPRFVGVFGDDTLAGTADNIGREVGVSRADSDRFALASQQKFEAARKAGFFDGEITSVTAVAGRAKTEKVVADEHPRPEATLSDLERLRPLDADGVVTAGNASGVNDGAAALLVGTGAIGDRYAVRPLARVVSSAVVGVPPRLMGLGPVTAVRKVLGRTGLDLRDIEVIEINEAFATQVLGCLKQLDISFDDPRVNPNGGAIAVGHPLGASGARLALTTARELSRRGGRYAVVSMCIGLGQGIAVVLERVT